MKKILSKLKEQMFNPKIYIEVRLGMVFISIGVIAAFLGILISLLASVSIWGIIIEAILLVCTPLTLYIVNKLDKRAWGGVIMVTGVIITIPLLWLTAGGLYSGLNIWFVFEFYFITIALKGRQLTVALIIASILDSMCFVINYLFPEYVFGMVDERASYISIIGSVIIVSTTICLTTFFQKLLFNNENEILERQQKELEEANDYQRSFLATMSHEIRSPINAVLGMNEMVLRTDDLNEIKEYSDNIQDAGQALLGLINDILDYSKIESGKMEINCGEYDTISLIKSSYSMLGVRAKEKGLEFHVKNHPDIPGRLYGDEIRIRQIITNLLTNALKYTDTGYMSLVINHKWIDDDNINLIIMVADSGIGISQENINKMFESFQRLDLTRNKAIEGTGLGLTITRNLVDMMGGTINVKSEKGKGSLFTIEIPQKVIDDKPTGSFVKEVQARLYQYKERFHAPEAKLLVVDDVKMNLVVVQGLLKKTMVQVDTALSGRRALEMVKNKKYDIILMDHMMPDMDGVETFHKIKESENPNKYTPVIMLTANAISGAEDEYMTEGFSDYISKPIKPELLEKMLCKYIPEEKVEK